MMYKWSKRRKYLFDEFYCQADDTDFQSEHN